jgi:hypothetical protein
MPRGRRSSPIAARSSPPPAPRQQHTPPPAVQHQPQSVMVMPAGRQPGMFAQMASTAAGVAVGSAVGHTIGAAITGGLSGRSEQPVEQQQEAPPAMYQQPQQDTNTMNQDRLRSPCAFELDQFIRCAQSQNDISLCSGFNEALRECKTRHGVQG